MAESFGRFGEMMEAARPLSEDGAALYTWGTIGCVEMPSPGTAGMRVTPV